jgi:hypothetical protein
MGIHGRLDENRFKPIYELPIPVIKVNLKVPILNRQLTVEAISNRRLRGQPFNPKSVGAMLSPARTILYSMGRG